MRLLRLFWDQKFFHFPSSDVFFFCSCLSLLRRWRSFLFSLKDCKPIWKIAPEGVVSMISFGFYPDEKETANNLSVFDFLLPCLFRFIHVYHDQLCLFVLFLPFISLFVLFLGLFALLDASSQIAFKETRSSQIFSLFVFWNVLWISVFPGWIDPRKDFDIQNLSRCSI